MRRIAAAVVTALALVASGCAGGGQALSAEDQVPRLGVVLSAIDRAIVAHDFDKARQQLRRLKTEVVEARRSGDLEPADARRILDAVAELSSALPAGGSLEAPTPSAPLSSASSGPSDHPSPNGEPTSTPTSRPTAQPTSAAPSTASTPTTAATSSAPEPISPSPTSAAMSTSS